MARVVARSRLRREDRVAIGCPTRLRLTGGAVDLSLVPARNFSRVPQSGGSPMPRQNQMSDRKKLKALVADLEGRGGVIAPELIGTLRLVAAEGLGKGDPLRGRIDRLLCRE
jgi:hypothetical protein